MKEKLHDSWLRLVYGPKRRKAGRKERPPGPTDPLDRVQVQLHRRKWFHPPSTSVTVISRYPTGPRVQTRYCGKCGAPTETDWEIAGRMKYKLAKCTRCGYSKRV